MLNGLVAYLNKARTDNQALIANNQQWRSYIEAKIALLNNANIAIDIMNGRRWAEDQAASNLGPPVPVASVFLTESMRTDATNATQLIAQAVPILEDYFSVAFPTGAVRIWYGFVLGNSGGGGVIYTEDRATYYTRVVTNPLPEGVSLLHELSHSYISNESLNHFLEMYQWNVLNRGTTDLSQWTWTSQWIPAAEANKDWHAVLDVYQLIGHETMRNAFRAVRPLRPAYGSPLSAAVIQAFVDQVPDALKSKVAAKLARITF